MAEMTHDKAVRGFFDTEQYLAGNPLIAVRTRLVSELLAGIRGKRVLDLGCGDGAISRPLLADGNHLTLVDFSPAMLARARAGTPAGADVEFVAADVLEYAPNTPYDVVLCVGVLAHLPAIEPMIARIANALVPGGVCVIQLTDSGTPIGWALQWYHRWRKRSMPYELKRMNGAQLTAIARDHHLAVRGLRRYALSLPGTGYLSAARRLRLEARFASSPWLSRAGAEALISFEKGADQAQPAGRRESVTVES